MIQPFSSTVFCDHHKTFKTPAKSRSKFVCHFYTEILQRSQKQDRKTPQKAASPERASLVLHQGICRRNGISEAKPSQSTFLNKTLTKCPSRKNCKAGPNVRRRAKSAPSTCQKQKSCKDGPNVRRRANSTLSKNRKTEKL